MALLFTKRVTWVKHHARYDKTKGGLICKTTEVALEQIDIPITTFDGDTRLATKIMTYPYCPDCERDKILPRTGQGVDIEELTTVDLSVYDSYPRFNTSSTEQ
jgi:Zn finger protein HypA/HybF involved in hydrogenase expression